MLLHRGLYWAVRGLQRLIFLILRPRYSAVFGCKGEDTMYITEYKKLKKNHWFNKHFIIASITHDWHYKQQLAIFCFRPFFFFFFTCFLVHDLKAPLRILAPCTKWGSGCFPALCKPEELNSSVTAARVKLLRAQNVWNSRIEEPARRLEFSF